MPFELIEDAHAIRCLICGTISRDPQDIERQYCPRCKRSASDWDDFRSQLTAGVQATRPELEESGRQQVVETLYTRYVERSRQEALMNHGDIS